MSEAALAVQSIPAYVEGCDLFIALVPDLFHSDTGRQCRSGERITSNNSFFFCGFSGVFLSCW